MPARYAEARNEVFPKIDRPGGSYRYEEQPSKGDKKTSNSSSKGTALITGASRGIGAVYAHRRAKRGFDLILVARSVEPLNALAASLSSASGRHITSIVEDLNNETDLAKVETKLKDDPSITMLVNNAGFASVAPLLEADIRKMQDMIALNVTALTRLTYAPLLPSLSVGQARSSTSAPPRASR